MMRKRSGSEPRRLAIVVSSPMTVIAFLQGHIAAMKEHYQITIICNNPSPTLPVDDDVESLHVAISREISPRRDLLAVIRLWRIFRINQFDLVHSVTPKAGLLTMLAAKLAGIPSRVHTFTGQVWATQSGYKRKLLKLCDKAIAAFATEVLVDSSSQRTFLRKEGVLGPNQGTVLGSGSISGVDLARFAKSNESRLRVRKQLSIADADFVFLFLGRLKREKGVLNLAHAFRALCLNTPATQILFVGPDEESLAPEIQQILGDLQARARFVPFTKCPEDYMNAADTLCLPSYREGFGSVIIEAAAVGIPTVASRIYGITDAVVDGKTGLLHTASDTADIEIQMRRMKSDPDLRSQLASAAQDRAIRHFSQEAVTSSLMTFYENVHLSRS